MVYVAITFIVLLFLNIYVSQVSLKFFYEGKETAMLDKAQLTAHEIGKLDLLTAPAIEEILSRTSNLTFTRVWLQMPARWFCMTP